MVDEETAGCTGSLMEVDSGFKGSCATFHHISVFCMYSDF
jgi:hypothetical protein